MKLHMCTEPEAAGDNYNYHMSISVIINHTEKHIWNRTIEPDTCLLLFIYLIWTLVDHLMSYQLQKQVLIFT